MSNSEAAAPFRPIVLGKDRLDECRWAYVLQAPFDMPNEPAALVGVKAQLDGEDCEIRGFVPRMPPRPITTGEPIELLVLARSR